MLRTTCLMYILKRLLSNQCKKQIAPEKYFTAMIIFSQILLVYHKNNYSENNS